MIRGLCRSALLGLSLASVLAGAAAAEVTEIRLGRQPGLSYLPLMVMEQEGLLDDASKAAGLPGLKYTAVQLASAAALNDGLLAGQVDYVAGAITVMAVLADKAAPAMEVRGVAALNSGAMYLNTTRAEVKSVRDFGDADRIAVSAVKLSIHAVLLQMAAAKEWGPDAWDRLDRLTVSLPHPDGMAALLSQRTEVTAHFTTPPFQFLELQDNRVHRLASTRDILGGPTNIALTWTTGKFREANPRAYTAFLAALEEATRRINTDKHRAAEIYIATEKSTMPMAVVEKLIGEPDNSYTTTPENTMAYVDFLKRTGRLKHDYKSWKDLFFPEIHDKAGS
jgi:NitT/TauT family transport system substrate-binding protein